MHQNAMELDIDQQPPEPLDFRYFRYSKLALPILIFLLLIFVSVICLTMWQSRSDIRRLRSGIPRDLEPSDQDDKETNMSIHRRNLRIAACVLAIFFAGLALMVFAAEMGSILRARLNYPIGIALIITGIVAIVAFSMDMNSERDAKWCSTAPNMSQRCESLEDLATGASIFDALVAVFAITSGVLVVAYTFTGDWAREKVDYSDGMLGQYDTQPGLIPNGVSTVRKKVTLLALIVCLIMAIILLIFTILLHENRRRHVVRDAWNRTVSSGDTTEPGWPAKNTKLRYTTSALVIVTVLFNLVPLTSRTIAYILGFLYLCYTCLALACFGLDADSLNDAKDMTCPSGLDCVYHPYNATIALEFIGAVVMLAYIAWEYFFSKRQKLEDPIQ
eukprot:NODE_850_length_1411_cov_553.206314_g649_i1.p1 GENE.NODE_850_length_1411_cov_553.206314_g649_i1~~NODE_850_length_1411_cov_553.206314_g649_i1.p1  ORF type:complete len:389 (-),score=97.21 NODE_850_length_1411_cov_553.206314_g649_i1:184-1350(-)